MYVYIRLWLCCIFQWPNKCLMSYVLCITQILLTIVLINLMTFHMRISAIKCIIDAKSAKCTYHLAKLCIFLHLWRSF